MGPSDIGSRVLDGAAAGRRAGHMVNQAGEKREPDAVDTTTPDVSRVYGYFLGEKENHPADRAAADQLSRVWSDVGMSCRASRAFVLRATEYATSKGVRQIIDMGCGIPTKLSDNVHEVAQRVLPAARVVYADKNPLVRRHCARDLAGVDGCTYVHHDFLDGASLYEQPRVRDHLDLAEPVTLLLGDLLHFVPGEIAYTVVADLVRPLAPGSRLVIASIASDLRPALMEEAMAHYSGRVTTSFARSRTEIERFFDGLTLEEPGVVTPPQWHSDPGDVIPPPQQVCTWAAVGVVG
ncbi:SAM-dependent methyltransferase [Streptomyces sp. NPDC088194]|uniref:SAM-dependent methyltransferase n=1 Tax=Streptomyces sp. NPDC088194 TaxID=3154931 RepID=UPI00344D91F6